MVSFTGFIRRQILYKFLTYYKCNVSSKIRFLMHNVNFFLTRFEPSLFRRGALTNVITTETTIVRLNNHNPNNYQYIASLSLFTGFTVWRSRGPKSLIRFHLAFRNSLQSFWFVASKVHTVRKKVLKCEESSNNRKESF